MGSFLSKPANKSAEKEEEIIIPPSHCDSYVSPQKKYITLLIRYIGTGYHGLQYQDNAATIEGVLFKALASLGYIPDDKGKCRGKINWTEASRTDTGVHACAGLVEWKMTIHEELSVKEVVENINKELPEDSPVEVVTAFPSTNMFPIQKHAEYRKYNYLVPTHTFSSNSSEHLRYLREEICPAYIGKHNFHNFTSNMPAKNKSAMRYITDFTFGDPFMIDGTEFVLFYIRGASFMINQIRKMVGAVVAASYNQITREQLDEALTEKNATLNVLPGDGLMLTEIEYSSNKRGVAYEFREWRPCIDQWKRLVLFKHIAKIVKEEDMFRKWVNEVLKNKPFKFNE